MKAHAVLKKPIALTEKANLLRNANNQVVFRVALGANKVEIKEAVQSLFNVHVTHVNTMIIRGKDKRMGRGYAKRQNWKKAVVV